MQTVLVDKLRGGMVVGKDIPNRAKGMMPLVRANSILTHTTIEQLKERGVQTVYINDRLMLEPEVRQKIYVPPAKPIISPQLRNDAITSLRDVFESVSLNAEDVHASSARVIKHLDNVVHELVDSLTTNQNALVNIIDLKSYDDYTYHHSLSVAVLSIALGQQLRFNQNELHRLGMGAMLHDIGKTAVPIEVTNKKGKLDEDEFAVMKTHPNAGYEQMSKTGVGDEAIWRSVLFHHEKVDGSGYPYGLRKDDIPVFSRIMAVADVYDALTSDRPYRTPIQPGEALEYLMGSTGTAFDFDIVHAFCHKIELYPVGAYVELSDGNIGVVLASDNPLRPVVRIVKNGELWDLNRDRDRMNITVVRQLISLEN